MSSVGYFTTVLSKLAYVKNETQLLCRTLTLCTYLAPEVRSRKKKPSGTQVTTVYRTF